MDFVKFEIAKKLKEKGFRKECFAHYPICGEDYAEYNYIEDDSCGISLFDLCRCYNNEDSRLIDAPTISQVLKWLREEKGFIINVFLDDDSDTPVTYEIYDVNNEIECVRHHHGEYFTIEDWDKASLAGIEYVLDDLI